MKHFLGFCLAGTLNCYCFSQTLYGYVTEQNSGKKPVANVLVKALFANEQLSKSDGEFTLTFQNTNPGNSVSISAEKKGWVVVNEKEMNINLPENPKGNKMKIVMCAATVLEARKKEYYNITDKYIMEAYNKKLAAINKEKAGWEKQVAALQDELHQLQKQLIDIADEYSRTNLDDLTAKERQAFELYRQGKIEESNKLRESFESEKNLFKTRSEINKLEQDSTKIDSIKNEKKSEMAFHRRNLKHLAIEAFMRFDIANAAQKFRLLVSDDSTDYENVFWYASCLSQQKKLDSAIRWYKVALSHKLNSEARISILRSLGNAYQKNNNYSEAERAFKEVLNITKDIEDSVKYLTNSAYTKFQLANLYLSRKGYDVAEQACKESLEIFKRLSRQLVAIPDTSKVSTNHSSPEEEYMEQWVKQYKKFFKNNAGVYNVAIASCLMLLGQVYNETHRYIESVTVCREGLNTIRRADLDEVVHATMLGEANAIVAEASMFVKQFAEAEQAAREALNPPTKNKSANYDKKFEPMNITLAIAFLYQGKYEDAKRIFLSLKDRPNRTRNNTPYQQEILEDLDELEKAGITHPDVAKARDLLKK